MMTHWGGFPYTGNLLADIPLAIARIGWIGVDMFFVISGFLITGILLDTRDSPQHFRNFYARRALRIFPLYYAVLIVITIIMPRLQFLDALPNYNPNIHARPMHFLFLTNIAEGMGFSNNRLTVPLWSLSVEEHFYLLWPLFLYRYHRHALHLCICGILFSFALRAFQLHVLGSSDRLVGFFTPCRVDSLLGGAAVAVLVRRGADTTGRMLAWARRLIVPAALVLPAILLLQDLQGKHRYYPNSSQHPWVVSVGIFGVAIFFTCVLVLAAFGNWGHRLIMMRPVRGFGKMTYCGYLVHEPVHVLVVGPALLLGFVTEGPLTWRWLAVNGFAFAVTVAICILSWHWFEKPLLDLKRFFPRAGGEIQEPLDAPSRVRTQP